MLSGFNHNINHQGRTFHCQTEDSGFENPHVCTHVFFGGNIIASKKTSYEEKLQDIDLLEHVAQLMKEQHKSLIKELVSGKLDALIQERCPPLAEHVQINVEEAFQEDTSLSKTVVHYIETLRNNHAS